MNRYFYLTLAAALLVIVLIGIWIWKASSAPPPQTQTTPSGFTTSPNYTSNTSVSTNSSAITPQPTNQDEQAVLDAYQGALSRDNVDNIKPNQTVVRGLYALQLWTGDHASGEALLSFDQVQNKWVIVDPGGGRWSVEGLVLMGVPEETAQALLAGRSK